MTREYYNRRRAKDAILTYVSKYGYTDIAVFVAQDGAIYIVIPDINDTDDIFHFGEKYAPNLVIDKASCHEFYSCEGVRRFKA